MSFEERLQRLEEITKLLQDESLPLEEKMTLYRESKEVASSLHATLDQAELEIRELQTKNDDEGDWNAAF